MWHASTPAHKDEEADSNVTFCNAVMRTLGSGQPQSTARALTQLLDSLGRVIRPERQSSLQEAGGEAQGPAHPPVTTCNNCQQTARGNSAVVIICEH
jgi:hypothetical protein